MRRSPFLSILILFAAGCKPEPDPHSTFSTTPVTIQVPASLPRANFPADNPTTEEGISLGRKLFWDPVLSADSSQSCASCHAPSFAFTDHGLATSIGIRGQNGMRNSMPILNLVYQPSFFWDGRATTLHHQALMPIQDPLEMDDDLPNVVDKLQRSRFYPEEFFNAFGSDEITPERIGLALEQFMLTFISGNSKFDRFQLGLESLTPEEERGMVLFNTEYNPASPVKGADCFHCHGQGTFSNQQFMNNGLDSILTDMGLYDVTGAEEDRGKFKTPTLRNIALSGPYMHDGRFSNLFEVIDHYDSGVISESPNLDPQMHGIQQGLNLSQQEKADLVAFLLTLTDTAFINNPDFRNPF